MNRPGVLIALSYFYADIPRPSKPTVGKAECANLAIRSPEMAVKNPDNYGFFALGLGRYGFDKKEIPFK